MQRIADNDGTMIDIAILKLPVEFVDPRKVVLFSGRSGRQNAVIVSGHKVGLVVENKFRLYGSG